MLHSRPSTTRIKARSYSIPVVFGKFIARHIPKPSSVGSRFGKPEEILLPFSSGCIAMTAMRGGMVPVLALGLREAIACYLTLPRNLLLPIYCYQVLSRLHYNRLFRGFHQMISIREKQAFGIFSHIFQWLFVNGTEKGESVPPRYGVRWSRRVSTRSQDEFPLRGLP
jgi:hypothetical protein